MNEKEKELLNYIREQTQKGKYRWYKDVEVNAVSGIICLTYHKQTNSPEDDNHIDMFKFTSMSANYYPYAFIKVHRLPPLIPERMDELFLLEQDILNSINQEWSEKIDKIIREKR